MGKRIVDGKMNINELDVWLSTLIFIVLDLMILAPLIIKFQDNGVKHTAASIGATSALFWGILAVALIFSFWDFFYQFFYPNWTRWLVPLDFLLYGAIGLGMWWLAARMPGSAVLWFVLLGGSEGFIEHILGIYGFRILEKVPWLGGVTAFPVLVFSFFEYIFYWAVVAWLAYGLLQIGSDYIR